jgi:TRAP-type C4-dicarboxylate transport system permease small subunit
MAPTMPDERSSPDEESSPDERSSSGGWVSAARTADRWVERVSRTAAAICGASIAVLMLLTCIDVGRRYVTGRSLPGVIEYSEVLLAGVVFLGMGMAQNGGAHVRMEALITRFRPRARAWVEAGTAAFGAVLTAVLTVATAGEAIDSFQAGEYRHGLAEVPIWPAKMVIPLGLAILTAELVRTCVRQVLAAKRGEPAPAAGSDQPIGGMPL